MLKPDTLRFVRRRDFIRMGGGVAMAARMPALLRAQTAPSADVTLRISPVAVEIAPSRIISTIGYNGSAPGPLLRMKSGQHVTVNVTNDTDVPEYVHWHGLYVPADVDGAEEEGTPPVPPHGQRSYQFVANPPGTRWYHTHTMAMGDLHRGSYTGQFGFLVIDGGPDPGHYDQEFYLALRDWEPVYTSIMVDTDDLGTQGPQPEKPGMLDTRPVGIEVSGQLYSINDKALGVGEPIKVQPGQRALFHFLNASGIENRWLALPGHQFHVIALDGNPVPTPTSVDVLLIGPGERIDAIVEMNQPGVWILGAIQDDIRNAGLGVVIEYADQHREPQWQPPAKIAWDYTVFGKAGGGPVPAQTLDMTFVKIPKGAGLFNSFTVNGKPYPHDQEFVLQTGTKYRLVFHNRTDDSHPLHLHRHLFELADMNGKPTSGIMKDTVIVPIYGRVAVDFTADQPGLTLFHCHIQQHMDYGFKALLRYA